MIVRLMGEGQWQVDDALAARLHELDAATEKAVEDGDQTALTTALEALGDGGSRPSRWAPGVRRPIARSG